MHLANAHVCVSKPFPLSFALGQVWGTESIAPASMQAAMANVRLPVTDPDKASTLRDLLYEDYDIYIVVYKRGDGWWTRLSAQVECSFHAVCVHAIVHG